MGARALATHGQDARATICPFAGTLQTIGSQTVPPAGGLDQLEFRLDIPALVERQPAAKTRPLPGPQIGELRVRVEAGAIRITPWSLAVLPGRDDPAFPILGPAGDRLLTRVARDAFVRESGGALIRKYASPGDDLFTEAGYRHYADDLLERMTNPYLADRPCAAGRPLIDLLAQ